TFSDVTDKAGVAGTESGAFHSGATFFDYDRDGRLDLYVGSYVALGDKRYCNLGAVLSSCPPSEYRGSPDALYHNNGDGTFTNVTVAAKIYQPQGKNLSVGAADYDNDGWPDLFVANDGIEAYLYHNDHNGTFKRLAFPAAWLSRRKAAPWRQCASPSGITTTTAGSISTSPISRDPQTISGITLASDFSTKSAIRPASRAPRATGSASAGAFSITITMAGWTCASAPVVPPPQSNTALRGLTIRR